VKRTTGGVEWGGVLVWLGATPTKLLPPEVFAAVETGLRIRGRGPVTFAAGPADAGYLQRYPASLRERTLIWRRGLEETAAFFSCFDYFISGDTGPLHLAAALPCRTLGIFMNPAVAQYGYHDGERRFALQWQGPAVSGKLLDRYLDALLQTAASKNDSASPERES
jgi:hypothetical protein